MRKFLLTLIILAVAVPAIAMYQQRNIGQVDIVFYGQGQAPPVPFTHGAHITRFPCFACHHIEVGPGQRVQACRECHFPFANYAHNSCAGCHQKLFRRQIQCWECHRQ